MSTRQLCAIVALLLFFFVRHAGAFGHEPISMQVAGLKQPAEILVDHWGVPHIYAAKH